MSEPQSFLPVNLLISVIYREDKILENFIAEMEKRFGPIDLVSPPYDFSITDYYEKEMGSGLKRRFFSFERLYPPEVLVEAKLWSWEKEKEYLEKYSSEGRVINVDPGYLTSSLLVISTFKPFAHRIPLSKGVYAHLELLFKRGKVFPLEWTYPDFKANTYHNFLIKVRARYKEKLRKWRKT